MLVVHALWRDGRLVYWAEDSPLPTQPTGNLHPFAVPANETVTLMLPTVAGRPADSPELIRSEEPPRGKPSLKPWRVPIFGALPDGDVEKGASLRHFEQ